MGPIGDFLEIGCPKLLVCFNSWREKTPLEFPMFSGLSRLDGPTFICGYFGGAKVDIEPMKNKPWLCMVFFLVFFRCFLVLIFDGVWQLLAD